MVDRVLTLPIARSTRRESPEVNGRPHRRGTARSRWLLASAAVLAAAVLFVVVTGMRPAYDAYGWLVWARQATHLDLDTNAAPSWKPLTFLFTFLYVLVAGKTALWLWMVTAVAGAFAGAVVGGRIAYLLTGAPAGRRFAPWAAALFAGVAVLGIEGYWHFILIADSDPMITTLCLGAIYAQLSGRRRLAWLLLVLVALGRPEAWLVAAAYGLWAWREAPEMRRAIVAGLVAIPLLWFGIPALTSHSWLIAGEVEKNSTVSLHGNRLTGTVNGLLHLYEWPMQIAGLFAIGLAVVRRERTWLLLVGAAALWLAVEIAFGLHGWAPSPRYMFEPAAVIVVLTGAAVGRVLAVAPLLQVAPRRVLLARWVAIAAVVALVVTLVPHARVRARLAHNGILLGHTWARQIQRLHAVIAKVGGPKRILACGQAVTTVPFQSILAWETGQNVADVGWNPRRWIRQGKPIVLFVPKMAGWQVRPIHIPAERRATCARMSAESAFG